MASAAILCIEYIDYSHLRVDGLEELHVSTTFWQCMQISLQIVECQFVAWLEFAVLLTSFLDCVVGKMYILIVYLVETPHKTGCPHIPLLIPIPLNLTITNRNHHKDPNIKLPPIIQQRIRNILLYNKRRLFPLYFTLFSTFRYSLPNILQFVSTCYSLTSI